MAKQAKVKGANIDWFITEPAIAEMGGVAGEAAAHLQPFAYLLPLA